MVEVRENRGEMRESGTERKSARGEVTVLEDKREFIKLALYSFLEKK